MFAYHAYLLFLYWRSKKLTTQYKMMRTAT